MAETYSIGATDLSTVFTSVQALEPVVLPRPVQQDYVVPGRVSGDCEDHAIAKYYALQKLGFTQDELRILVVKDLNLGVGHCILGVITAGQCFILDNQIKSVWTADKIQHYKPIYAINETAWWQFVPAGQPVPGAEGAAAGGGGGGGADQGD